jgi:hypothetical protein
MASAGRERIKPAANHHGEYAVKKLLLALALMPLLWCSPALAQNPTCPTRPTGDSSNACASTAFAMGVGAPNGLSPNSFGAKCDSVTDDSAAFQAAINAALLSASRTVTFLGNCKIASALQINGPLRFQGTHGFVSILLPAVNIDCIDIALPTANGSRGIDLRDFSCVYPSAANAGTTGIKKTGPSDGQTIQERISNVSVYSSYDAINFDRSNLGVFEKIVANTVGRNAITLSNTFAPDQGNMIVSNSAFVAVTGSGILYNSGGGLTVANNKFSGSVNNAVELALANGAVTGDLFVIGNQIEGVNNASVLMRRLGTTGTFLNVFIANNVMQGGTGVSVPTDANGAWLTNITMAGNNYLGPPGANQLMYSLDSINNFYAVGGVALSGNATTKVLNTGSAAANGIVGQITQQGTFAASTIAGTNILNIDVGAWAAFTPTPVCGTATFTVNSSRFKTTGKAVFVEIDMTITAIGTCSGNTITWTLPNTANSPGNVSGREIAVAGFGANCTVATASATATCIKYDGSLTWAVNQRFVHSGVYESQ